MPDIHLTRGNDDFDQRSVSDPSGPWDWPNVFGDAGDDRFVLFGGNVVGGPGNDWIGTDPGVERTSVSVAFWDSPAGVVVDLAAGTAQDGWGGLDTLSGVVNAHGSGHDDVFLGSGADNHFWPNGGHDRIDGRGGIDRVGLGGTPSDYRIEVSGDATHAIVTSAIDPNLRHELTGIEYLNFWQDGGGRELALADFVTVDARARHLLLQDASSRWNADRPIGSGVDLSYSFRAAAETGDAMPGSGFQAFDAAQRELVTDILAGLSTQTRLVFREVADTPAAHGQIRFGISQQTGTAGFSYAPNDTGGGERAGDVWMDVETMAGIARGRVGFGVLLHEIGHALGLAHPRADGTLIGSPQGDDSTAFTVMSANELLDGIPRSGFGVYDLLALQATYGARTVNTGDDRYVLTDDAGLAQFVIDDDGGKDAIDASSLSYGVQLQLRANAVGALRCGSAGVRQDEGAALDNVALMPGSLIESATGTAFDDLIVGNELDNVFATLTGNDEVEGGDGVDTVVLPGTLVGYRFDEAYGILHASARDGESGSKALASVERLRFDDLTVNLEMPSEMAIFQPDDLRLVEELYVAFFNRVPNADGLAHWAGRLRSGDSFDSIADAFHAAGVQFPDLTGYRPGMSDRDFVNTVYRNVLARADGASAAGLDYWSGELAAGRATHGSLVMKILSSAHTFKDDATWGWVADLLDNKLLVADLFAVDWGLSFNTPRESIARGMAIAAAVTPLDTSAAIALIGVSEADMLELMSGG